MTIKILFPGHLLTHQLTAQSYKKIHAKTSLVGTHDDMLMLEPDRGMVFYHDLKEWFFTTWKLDQTIVPDNYIQDEPSKGALITIDNKGK